MMSGEERWRGEVGGEDGLRRICEEEEEDGGGGGDGKGVGAEKVSGRPGDFLRFQTAPIYS